MEFEFIRQLHSETTIMNKHHDDRIRHNLKAAGFPIGAGATLVLLLASVTLAASYVATSLQELTTRAVAVAEVEVVSKHYPQDTNASFPRTLVEMKLIRSLKGSPPQ